MPPSRSPYYLAIMILVFSLLSDLPHFNQCLIFTLSISLHYSKTFHGMHLPMVHTSLLCRANLLKVACLGDPPFFFFLHCQGSSLVAQRVKHLPAMQETQVQFLGQEDPLEKEMAAHSSTLAWKIPCTEKPGRLQSMGSQRVGHDWTTSLQFIVNPWLIWSHNPG